MRGTSTTAAAAASAICCPPPDDSARVSDSETPAPLHQSVDQDDRTGEREDRPTDEEAAQRTVSRAPELLPHDGQHGLFGPLGRLGDVRPLGPDVEPAAVDVQAAELADLPHAPDAVAVVDAAVR